MLKRVFLCFCLLMAGIGVVKAGDTYVKVTSPSDLVDGGEYILAATKDGVTYVAKSYSGNDPRFLVTSSGFSVSAGVITIDDATPLKFELEMLSSCFSLKGDMGYLGYSSKTDFEWDSKNKANNEKWQLTYNEATSTYVLTNFFQPTRFIGLHPEPYMKVYLTERINDPYPVVMLYRKVSAVTVSSACTDGARYYGTYSIGSSFIVPSDLTVSEIQVSDGKLVVSSYEAGDVVPANTGVMISAATAGAHQLTLSSAAGTSLYGAGNMLHASGEGITAEAMAAAHPGCKFYRLTMHLGTTLGYYWGAADGAAFALSANKAYLAVPAAASRLTGFDMADEEKPTGISAVLNDKERMKNDRGQALNDKVFDLNGRTVIGNVRGVVIKNGKKLLNK